MAFRCGLQSLYLLQSLIEFEKVLIKNRKIKRKEYSQVIMLASNQDLQARMGRGGKAGRKIAKSEKRRFTRD